MSSKFKSIHAVGPLFVLGASLWIALSSNALGDYPADSEAGIDALRAGHVGDFLSSHPVMGPFSMILRAPFAAIGGSDQVAAYQWGCFPCLLVLGMLGIYLGRIAERRGAPPWVGLLIPAICLFNPLTFNALDNGHPEELLTAALAVGGVAAASECRFRWAALLLGLAMATKQWAVIAIVPTILVLPERRIRVAVGAGVIAALLIVPTFIAAPGSFFDQQSNIAFGNGAVSPWNVWYPAADVTTTHIVSGGRELTLNSHRASDFVARWSHPLIVLVALLVPVLVAFRRRSLHLTPSDAMGALALALLLRCMLDPVDNMYYHLPLLLTLVGWDAIASPSFPVRGLLAGAVAFGFTRWGVQIEDPYALCAVYLTVALSALGAIAWFLFRPSAQPAGSWRATALRAGSPSLPIGS